MLALARALAVSPKLIIADELSLGLAPLVTESVFESLEEARQVRDHHHAERTVRAPRPVHGGQLRDPHPWPGAVVGAGIRGRPRGHRSISGGSGGCDANVSMSAVTRTSGSLEVPSARGQPAEPKRGESGEQAKAAAPRGQLIAIEQCMHNHHGGKMPVSRTMSRVLLTAADHPATRHGSCVRTTRRHRRPRRPSPSPTSRPSPGRAHPRTARRRPASRPGSTCRMPRVG